MWHEWSTLKKLIWLRKFAVGVSYILKTVTGAIVHIMDAVAGPMDALSVSVEPVQNGTGDPSPTNVRPITGFDSVNVWRTGKNLLDISLANRTLVTTGDYDNTSPRAFDKPYLYVGITMNNYFRNANIVSYSVGEKTVVVNTRQTAYGLGYTLPVKPGTAYTLSYKNKAISTMGIGYYDADGNYLGFNNINIETQWIFTTPTNCHNITVVFRPEQGSEFTYEEPQLELGSNATAYEPYNGNEYTIQLGETVYGGTLDVVNGKMTVDRAAVTISELSWTYNSTFGRMQTNEVRSVIEKPAGNDKRLDGLMCSAYTARSAINAGTQAINGTIAVATTGYIYILDEAYSDANAWKTAMGSQTIIYPLATPFEIPLTPEQISTLQGTNNVWSDAGDVTVTYRASAS